MAETDEKKTSINIDVGLKTELPSSSAARAVDALVDIFRPISEGLGLLGDKIRIQREETLLEIARRAQQRIQIEGAALHPLPPKHLIPLLEKASLEDINASDLVEMWANLLATSLTGNVEMIAQYTEILTSMTSDQVKILNTFFPHDSELGVGHYHDRYDYFNLTGIPGVFDKLYHIDSPEKLLDEILEEIGNIGIVIDTVSIYPNKEGAFNSLSYSNTKYYSDDKFMSFANLERMGIIERIEVKRKELLFLNFDLYYYIVTPVGSDFFACCNPDVVSRD